MQARRARIKILYNNKDISEDVSRFLISFSYNDVMSGAADDIDIILEDRADLWKGDWLPDKGAMLKVSIITEHWKNLSEGEKELPLGLFEIDEIECSGKPEVVKIKGVSVPDNTSLRGVDKTRSWEKTKLSVIANDIAKGANMNLFYDTKDNPLLDRVEQTDESDLKFLLGLCNNAGLALKVSDNKIIIFDEYKYEQAKAIGEIKRAESLLLSYTFNTSTRGTYASCRVKYQGTKKKAKFDYTYTLPNKNGKTLQVNEEVRSIGEAETLARKKLREANKDEVTASLNVLGNIEYAAGNVYNISGFKKFDGRYIIVQASHSIGSGYTISLEFNKSRRSVFNRS